MYLIFHSLFRLLYSNQTRYTLNHQDLCSKWFNPEVLNSQPGGQIQATEPGHLASRARHGSKNLAAGEQWQLTATPLLQIYGTKEAPRGWIMWLCSTDCTCGISQGGAVLDPGVQGPIQSVNPPTPCIQATGPKVEPHWFSQFKN